LYSIIHTLIFKIMTTIALSIALVINLLVSAIIANLSLNREISSKKVFWFSFLLTPIIGMFATIISPVKVEQDKYKEDYIVLVYPYIIAILIFAYLWFIFS
jgi:hypothetical protein